MANHSQITGSGLHAPSRHFVSNNTGSTIPKWTVVDLNGFGAVFPQVVIGNPSLLPNFGITEAEILTGQSGFVCSLGFLYNIDTSLWTVGTPLYSSSVGVLQSTVNGPPVGLVVKQDAVFGVIYVTASIENQSTTNSNWQLTGNPGTNPSIDFIGTTDNQPLVIRTNNAPVAKITQQGQFGLGEQNPDEFVHIKAHPGMDGSGHRITTYSLTTSDTNWNTAYSYTLPSKSTMQITATAIGYNSTTLTRSSFKQTGTIWRETSIAVFAGPLQTDYTYKSASGYKMRIKTLSNQVIVEIQAHSSELTKWSGSVIFDITTDV